MDNYSAKLLSHLRSYCSEHGLDIESLPSLFDEPKLVPMIRGIGFEYVVEKDLKQIFSNSDRFTVNKPIINAQFEIKDVDVEIFDRKSQNKISIECKLAKNNSFRIKTKKNNFPHCSIKIMRSRTLGEQKIAEFSKKENIDINKVSSHKDSYLSNHFDYIVTNLRNAFYRTTEDGLFRFAPTKDEVNFLEKFFEVSSKNEVDEKLKNTHFYIKAEKLTPKNSGIECPRKACQNKHECEFIPNYPIFRLDNFCSWKPINYLIREL